MIDARLIGRDPRHDERQLDAPRAQPLIKPQPRRGVPRRRRSRVIGRILHLAKNEQRIETLLPLGKRRAHQRASHALPAPRRPDGEPRQQHDVIARARPDRHPASLLISDNSKIAPRKGRHQLIGRQHLARRERRQHDIVHERLELGNPHRTILRLQ